MKRSLCCLMTALIFLMAASVLHAQTTETDVIYLKNGSKIKGTIVEVIRDRTVKIKVAEGGVYVFPMSDVKNIEMNPQSTVQVKEQTDETTAAQPQQPNAATTLFQVNAFAGIALPTGTFASTTDTDGGAAETGFVLGLDGALSKGHKLAWMSSFVFAWNGVNIPASSHPSAISVSTGSWTSIWMLTGFKIFGDISPTTQMYGFAQFGALIGKSPSINITVDNMQLQQESDYGLGVGYGIGAGITSHGFMLGVRYLGGKPQYEPTITDGIYSATGPKFSQSTGCFLITAGIAF